MKARSYLFLFFMVCTFMSLDAQITGTVFRDYNINGVKDSNEPVIAGVIVTAYNASGVCGTTTSTSTGASNYSLTGCGSGPVRVEFTIPTPGSCNLNGAVDFTSGGGANYGSSVQFANGNSSNVNFALNAPEDYFNPAENPKLYVPCYINGDPANANVAAADAFVGVNYDASSPTQYVATVGEIGSTWGVAYSKQAQKIFTGAFLKRHVGMGPLGSGGIYLIDPITNTVTNWLDLDAIGIATRGTGTYTGPGPLGPNVPYSPVIGTNAERDLGNGLDQPSYDAPAYAQIGRLSLGDVDISDDGRYLFVMNLYDKTVYRIDLVDPANPQAPTIANVGTRVTSWAVPSPGCANGTHRPFALEFARGNLFVGLVCTAESGGTNTDLDGYVYQVTNFTAGTYSTLFSIPLDYDKGYASSHFGDIPAAEATKGWFPWSDDASFTADYYLDAHPQPMLSDIVFDSDGSLILAFMDRLGHQLGWNNYNPHNTNLVVTTVGGDLLRAYYNPSSCTYELESNGKEGPSSPKPATGGANNGEGPGGGEFYYRDCYSCDPDGFHQETTQGGIAVALGSGEVAVAVIDPSQLDSAGLTWYNNTTGTDTKDYELYFTGNSNSPPPSGTFSKANGLGDMEVSGTAAPIEIGNRVWADTDGDGIQDADEAPIAGVTVQLIQGTTVIATATTDASGNYYFSSAAGTNTASAIYSISQLDPNMTYIVRIPNVQGGSKQAALGANSLTVANVGGAGQPDVRDSDGTAVGDNAEVTVLTTDIAIAGANNHTFDFGFGPVACVTPTATAASTNPTCAGSTAQNNGIITISGFTMGQRYQYTSGATFSGTATPASITAIPVGGVIVNTLPNTTQQYTVRIYDATDDVCFLDRVVSITAAVCGDCNCTDMIYLNDETGDVVHKFSLDATSGSLSEIGSPWLDNPPGINNPHGIAIDLNGFVYIASAGNPIVNPPWDSHFNGGKVFKLQADGTMINPNPDPTAVNFTEWNANWGTENGILYVPNAVDETVDAYELCSGTYIGSMFAVNNGGDVQTWGFYVENGKWYWPNQSDGGVFTGSTDLNLYTIPATNSGVVLFNHGINPDIFLSATPLGMTRDAAGNFYIIRGAIGGGAAEIRKYNPAGTFITSVSDNSGSANATNGLPGFYGARGIAYSKMTNKLYIGSFENCVSVFDTDLVQQTALNIGNPTNGRPKGIGILTECCPTVANETIDKVVCSNGNGEKVFLQNLLDCGEGTIGEGNWVEVTNTSGGNIEFNECDLSITVNGSGCATYTLSKISPSGGNQQCGPFSITLNICTEVPSATVAGAQGTCTGANPNNDAIINITAAMNANQAGVSTGATYSGPAYGNVANIDISGGSGSFTGRMHNTQYTVRIFNGSNDCYVDYTVTTPTIVCCALTVVCTPQPQTNCSPVNGSASVVASNAVGTVTYLWSSGETTSTISNKAAGTYTVTVTDGGVSGCSRTCEAVIANQANAPTCTITVNNQPSCANLTGGDITVVPSPAGTYTYTWSDNGAATATRTGLTGGTYTVTITNTTTNCTGVCNVTLDTPMNCCNIAAIVPQNIECIDNGTPALITDNRIRFSAQVTNTNTSLTGYNVTINGGTTITPNMNVPYGVTQFTLGVGTAGGGATFTVTVTDSATPGCTQTFQVVDPGNCAPVIPECPPVKCGTATIQVNGN